MTPVQPRQSTNVVLVGYGATGRGIARLLNRRSDVRITGIVDPKPSLAGTLVGANGTRVSGALDPGRTDAALVFVSTTSRIAELEAVAAPWLSAGANVISLCEELGFPWRTHPKIAARLHDIAADAGVTILGAGANPGFAMDLLPLTLTAVLPGVESVEIRRTIDLADYGDLVSRFGIGRRPSDFEPSAPPIVGHIGFEQSISHLAHVLDFELDEISVERPTPVATAREPRRGPHFELGVGGVTATRQRAEGIRRGECVIGLTEFFAFRPAAGEVPLGDAWQIEGGGRTLELTAPDGLPSLDSTVSIAANLIDAVIAAPPGLATMSELPIAAFAARAASSAVG